MVRLATVSFKQKFHTQIVQVEEDDDDEEEDLEDELLDCLMCHNETLVDFLRKHIKFHHMIQVGFSVVNFTQWSRRTELWRNCSVFISPVRQFL